MWWTSRPHKMYEQLLTWYPFEAFHWLRCVMHRHWIKAWNCNITATSWVFVFLWLRGNSHSYTHLYSSDCFKLSVGNSLRDGWTEMSIKWRLINEWHEKTYSSELWETRFGKTSLEKGFCGDPLQRVIILWHFALFPKSSHFCIQSSSS